MTKRLCGCFFMTHSVHIGANYYAQLLHLQSRGVIGRLLEYVRRRHTVIILNVCYHC